MSSLFKLFKNQFGVFTNTKSSAEKKNLKQHKWLSWLEKIINVFTSIPSSKTSSATKQDLSALFAEDDKVKKDIETTKAKLRKVLKDIDSNKDDVELLNHVLRLIAQFRDKEALADVAKILNEDIDLSTKEHALETLITLDPNLENKKSREAILAFIRDSYTSEYIRPFLFDEAYPNRFLWLKEFIEAEYQDPQKDLEISDLEFLKVVSSLKPKIADFSDQLTEVFMFNQYDSYYKHAAIDVLNLYFPESGPIKKPVIEDYKVGLKIFPTPIEKSLIRKIENYTGDKKFPAWDSSGYLISDSTVLQKNQNLISRCEISGSTMEFDKDQKPKCFKNCGLELSVDYFYNERGSLAAIKIKHQGCEYPFIVREDEQEHEHMILFDYADLKDSRKYPSLKLLASGEDAEKKFLFHDPNKLTIFGDGRIQINEEGKIILLATNGSLLVSDNEHQGLKEFITTSGEYHYLEPVFSR